MKNKIDSLLDGVLERNEEWVRRTLERAETDESFRMNVNDMFWVRELSAYISIAKYGNERARRLALIDIYNITETTKKNINPKYTWGDYFSDFAHKLYTEKREMNARKRLKISRRQNER
ncbi:MAG: hypothetical protein Pg6C_17800 [Treponemataceae bacterium]|nr:MAG: hypothetical protein Pg6C_17800 [Treponemataceae bacterium]